MTQWVDMLLIYLEEKLIENSINTINAEVLV